LIKRELCIEKEEKKEIEPIPPEEDKGKGK
jgi:hypothetical protein